MVAPPSRTIYFANTKREIKIEVDFSVKLKTETAPPEVTSGAVLLQMITPAMLKASVFVNYG
jgi:hypothetical protein